MRSKYLRSLLSFLLLCVFTTSPASAKYLFLLDLDGVVVKEHREPMVDRQSRVVEADGKTYEVAEYLSEFNRFLVEDVPQLLGEDVVLAVFSAGTHLRNTEVVKQLNIVHQSGAIVIVKSFPDLYSLEKQDFVRNLPGDQLEEWLKAKPEKDRPPFFASFTKDLKIFGFDLNKTVIIEDNFNAVPVEQQASLLLVPRYDGDESRLNLQHRNSKDHWLDPPFSKTAMWRTKYRLVRAAGLLSLALKEQRQTPQRALTEILFSMQWTPERKLRADFLNSVEVYKEGFKVLKAKIDAPIAAAVSKTLTKEEICEQSFLIR